MQTDMQHQENNSAYVKPQLVELGRMANLVKDQFNSYFADGGMTTIGGMMVLLTKPS
jgi:hypothetical protein